MNPTLTRGVHHVGLTVPDLAEAQSFLVDLLGFEHLGGKPDYPAAFLSDGHTMITLWQAKPDAPTTPFDRFHHLGLHHLAFAVGSLEELDQVHARLASAPGVEIEFAPEPLNEGPATHMMVAGPGGIRLEFIHRPA